MLIRSIGSLCLLIVILLVTGCPGESPKGLTKDCQECEMTQENKNSCFDRCAGVDGYGRKISGIQQSDVPTQIQYFQTKESNTGGTWEQYLVNNLDPESVERFLRYKHFITFATERCGSHLGGHAPFNPQTRSVKIVVCSGRGDLEIGLTIAHELVHAQSMINTSGQWDHETTALAECRFIQRKHPALLSTRYTMCNQSNEDIVAYGRENGGTIAETEEER